VIWCPAAVIGSGVFNLGSMESKEIFKMLLMFALIEILIYLLFSFYWIDINPKTWSLESRAFFASISGVILLMFGICKIIDKQL
jgi:glucan phosphoethanolaminetransferase (alkaline phosphatase superfamily)